MVPSGFKPTSACFASSPLRKTHLIAIQEIVDINKGATPTNS